MGLVGRGAGRVVPRNLVLVGIEASQQGCQGWAAKGCGYIAAPKEGAFRGKFVEVWCLDVRMPHEAVVRVRLVIGKDEDDVRSFGDGGVQGQKEAKENVMEGSVVHLKKEDWAKNGDKWMDAIDGGQRILSIRYKPLGNLTPKWKFFI